MSSDVIYLDHAAATPMDEAVFAAMQPYFTEQFYNPSALYQAAGQVKKDIAAARATIAGYLGARGNEIIFTAGGSEANNLAIHGVMQAFPDNELVVLATEHDSVLEPAKQYQATLVQVHPDGQIDMASLANVITDKTVLVSIQYANNEIGTIQSLKDIAAAIADVKKVRTKQGNDLPLYFHTDACQAPNLLDLHVSRLSVDMMTINAGKIYGPKQVGALYAKAGIALHPQVLGGGQEKGLRSGTENVPGIIGFAKALSLVQEQRHDETARLADLQHLCLKLLEEKLPQAELNGSRKHRLANNIHITIPGTDNEALLMQLDNQGIICAVGSACNASNDEPSHVLKAIGLSDAEAQSSLRFTMGHGTSEADINKLVDALVASIA